MRSESDQAQLAEIDLEAAQDRLEFLRTELGRLERAGESPEAQGAAREACKQQEFEIRRCEIKLEKARHTPIRK